MNNQKTNIKENFVKRWFNKIFNKEINKLTVKTGDTIDYYDTIPNTQDILDKHKIGTIYSKDNKYVCDLTPEVPPDFGKYPLEWCTCTQSKDDNITTYIPPHFGKYPLGAGTYTSADNIEKTTYVQM